MEEIHATNMVMINAFQEIQRSYEELYQFTLRKIINRVEKLNEVSYRPDVNDFRTDLITVINKDVSKNMLFKEYKGVSEVMRNTLFSQNKNEYFDLMYDELKERGYLKDSNEHVGLIFPIDLRMHYYEFIALENFITKAYDEFKHHCNWYEPMG